MTAHDLVAEVRADGHDLLIGPGGALVVSLSGIGQLDPELRRRLADHDQAVRDYLAAETLAREAAHAVATDPTWRPPGWEPIVRLDDAGNVDTSWPED
jgi:hypothetical protein